MENRRNYYRLLHVQPNAAPEIIKSSYKTLMQKLKMHPDLGGDLWHAQLLNEAYEVLSNPEKRKQYDQNLIKQYMGQNFHREQFIQSFCRFCKTPHKPLTLKHHHNHEKCVECSSPLELDVPTLDGKRLLERFQKNEPLFFYTEWPAKPEPGEIEDLSPKGLSFNSPVSLNSDQIIKIKTKNFEAVAKIIHVYQSKGTTNTYRYGVEFITAHFENSKGNFIKLEI